MGIDQIARKYGIDLDTVTRMVGDGVINNGSLLTTEQVAARYQIQVETVQKLARAGQLPVRRLKGSRLLRFDPREIEAALTGSSVESVRSNVLELKR